MLKRKILRSGSTQTINLSSLDSLERRERWRRREICEYLPHLKVGGHWPTLAPSVSKNFPCLILVTVSQGPPSRRNRGQARRGMCMVWSPGHLIMVLLPLPVLVLFLFAFSTFLLLSTAPGAISKGKHEPLHCTALHCTYLYLREGLEREHEPEQILFTPITDKLLYPATGTSTNYLLIKTNKVNQYDSV